MGVTEGIIKTLPSGVLTWGAKNFPGIAVANAESIPPQQLNEIVSRLSPAEIRAMTDQMTGDQMIRLGSSLNNDNLNRIVRGMEGNDIRNAMQKINRPSTVAILAEKLSPEVAAGAARHLNGEEAFAIGSRIKNSKTVPAIATELLRTETGREQLKRLTGEMTPEQRGTMASKVTPAQSARIAEMLPNKTIAATVPHVNERTGAAIANQIPPQKSAELVNSGLIRGTDAARIAPHMNGNKLGSVIGLTTQEAANTMAGQMTGAQINAIGNRVVGNAEAIANVAAKANGLPPATLDKAAMDPGLNPKTATTIAMQMKPEVVLAAAERNPQAVAKVLQGDPAGTVQLATKLMAENPTATMALGAKILQQNPEILATMGPEVLKAGMGGAGSIPGVSTPPLIPGSTPVGILIEAGKKVGEMGEMGASEVKLPNDFPYPTNRGSFQEDFKHFTEQLASVLNDPQKMIAVIAPALTELLSKTADTVGLKIPDSLLKLDATGRQAGMTPPLNPDAPLALAQAAPASPGGGVRN